MPFALKTAQVSLHRVKDIILSSVWRQLALVYLEDIFFISKTPQELVAYMKMVLKLHKEATVTLKLDESAFLWIASKFWVFSSKSGRPETPHLTADDVYEVNVPTTLTKLR